MLIFEDNVREPGETDDIDADLTQRLDHLLALQHAAKLVLRNRPVAVFVHRSEYGLQSVLHIGHCKRLPLHCSNRAHHFAEDTDEHIHHGHGREQHKQQVDACDEPIDVPQLLQRCANAVHERPTHQQRVHRHGDVFKVHVAHLGVDGQLGECDAKYVQQEAQQAQGEEDGACSCRDALDQNHQLRHGSEEAGHPRHAGEPRQACHAQDGRIAQSFAALSARHEHEDG
mmetsp:Transcript_58441/g.167756  ORF Transcript_58441/g.167756 Transcript_58441/m.167756 type:complete len:228 (-) Transcript_58441:64-747(-)